MSQLAHLNPQKLTVDSRVHPFEIRIRRNYRFLKDQNSLDYTCDSTSTLKVSNITLDSTTTRRVSHCM